MNEIPSDAMKLMALQMSGVDPSMLAAATKHEMARINADSSVESMQIDTNPGKSLPSITVESLMQEN